MLSHGVVTALRHFRRHKLITLVNFACLMLALLSFFLAYGAVSYYRQADRQFPLAEQVHFVAQTFRMGNGGTEARINALPWVAAPLLRADFPVLEEVVRWGGALDTYAEVGGRRIPLQVSGADAAFFRLFPLEFRPGRREGVLDAPHEAVLSAPTAQRLFGADDPIGRILQLQGGVAVEIAGVAELPAPPSHIDADSFQLVLSMGAYRALYEWIYGSDAGRAAFETWQAPVTFRTYLLLPRRGAPEAAVLNGQLQEFVARHVPESSTARVLHAPQLAELSLPYFSEAGERWSSAAVVLALATIVLAVSCLNHAILSAAQSGSRLRELGVRRAIGAGRWAIARQHLLEAAMLAGLAFVGACLLSMLLIPLLRSAIEIDMVPVLAGSFAFWVGALFALAAATCLAAAYPAILMGMLRPVEALRGAGTVRAAWLPKLLVGVQFVAVGFLLVAVLIIQQQNGTLRSAGMNLPDDPIVILSNDLRAAGVDPETLRAELARQPFVRSVGFSWLAPWSGAYSMSCCLARGAASSAQPVLNRSVSHDYFVTAGIDLLAGRTFDATRSEDVFQPQSPSNAVIVDRSTAAAFGWSDPQAALGQELHAPRRDGAAPYRYRIIGVVEDRYIQALGPSAAAVMYWLSPDRQAVPHIRIAGENVAAGLESIDRVWQALAPHTTIERRFMDELFAAAFASFERNARIVSGLCALALAISLSGLIAMAVQVANRRRREIGIRKTLGAGVGQIVLMLLREFSRPVVLANVAAWPLAYLAARSYLDMFVIRTGLTIWPFLASLTLVILATWFAVGLHALRAAHIPPASVLRSE